MLYLLYYRVLLPGELGYTFSPLCPSTGWGLEDRFVDSDNKKINNGSTADYHYGKCVLRVTSPLWGCLCVCECPVTAMLNSGHHVILWFLKDKRGHATAELLYHAHNSLASVMGLRSWGSKVAWWEDTYRTTPHTPTVRLILSLI